MRRLRSGTLRPHLADAGAGALFLALALAAMAGAVGLQVGTPSEPQPGFFPFMGSLALAVLSLLLIVQGLRGRSSGSEPFVALKRPLLAAVGLTAFALLLDPLGYVIATAALMALLLAVLEIRSPWAYATSLVIAVGSYLLFDRALDVPLPEGLLGMLFGH